MGNYATTFKQAAQYPRALSGELQTLSTTSKQKFGEVTTAAAGLGVGLVGAFAFAAGSAMKFDKQLSELGAVSGANAGQMDKLRTSAINAGQATVFSAGEAATAETELSKAGLSVSDILGGALNASLALASAGTLSLADAATDTATELNIFGLSGFQASHVADLLSAGANESATDVKGLADSMNQAGLVAHQTGLSIEDTTGVLALFAQNGLKGSDAGTSFKTMLQALQSPSKITKALMDDLGISAYDAGGKFIGIAALAQQLQTQLKGLTQAQRDAALAQIFGTDAVRSADILYTQGAAGVSSWIDKVNQTGAAADTASQKMNNLSGDVENLKGSLETLTISTGSGVQGGLRSLTQAATRLVNSLSVMPASVSKIGISVVGVTGGLIAGAAAFEKISAKSSEFQETLTKMGPAGAKAASGLNAITVAGGKLGLTLGVLQATSAAFGSNISPQVSETVKDLTTLGDTGKATGTELKQLDYDLGTIGSGGVSKFENGVSGTIESLTGLGNVMDQSLTHANERLSAIDQGLSAMVSAGKIQEAAAAYQVLQDDASKQGISMSDLSNALPNYTASLDSYNDSLKNGASASDGLAGATSGLSAAQASNEAAAASSAIAQDEVANSINDTIGSAKGLQTLLDNLNGTNDTVVKTTDDMYAAFDSATASIKSSGKTMDETTAKGRANREALLGIVSATEAASQATLNQNGTAEQANAVLEKGRKQFIADAIAMGDTAKQAQALADKLFALPPVSSVQVKAPGLTEANQTATGYSRIVNDIPKDVNTRFMAPGLEQVNGTGTGYFNLMNKIPKDVNTKFLAPGLEHVNDTASGYFKLMNEIDGRKIYAHFITDYQTVGKGPNKASENRWGGVYSANAAGGVYQHAADGLLSQATTYSPVNPGRYMIAEPGTGGEAFIPRFGDFNRSMGILNQAAGWYGAQLAPRGAGSTGGGVMELRISADAGASPMVNMLRFEIAQLGGDPVRLLTPR